VEIVINGKTFIVSRTLSGNRNAAARLRGGVIQISLPSRWPAHEKERVADNLLRRSIRAIESGKWRLDAGAKVSLSNGQRVTVMGIPFDIAFVPGTRFGSRTVGGRIEVRMDSSHQRAIEKASALARKRLVEAAMPALEERVGRINREHFGASVSSVSVRDTVSRWGSCSSSGAISLSLRLLFMPAHILDYVIVHELAHTRYRSHGKRFWALVESVVPDHQERRRWLRENGWKYPGGEGMVDKMDFYEEPY
jgi:predicted metal-dependent hydrolase